MKDEYGIYNAYHYDLWGNDKDGYEVNDIYLLEKDIVIMDELLSYPAEKELIRFVKRLFGLKKGLRYANFDITGEPEYTLYINYNEVPVGEFRNQGNM